MFSLAMKSIVTLLLAAGFAIAQGGYELVIIEPLDTGYPLAVSSVSGLNNLNQVSGGLSAPNSPIDFVWTRDAGVTPVNLSGAINDQGVIVWGDTIRWPDGTLQILDDSFRLTSATALNNANVVVEGPNFCGTGGGTINSNQLWDPANGVRSFWEDFGIPSVRRSTAINNHNEIVGVQSVTQSCGDDKAFYFNLDTGEYLNLHQMFTGQAGGITEVFDINDQGLAVGVGPSGGVVRPFLWDRDLGFTLMPAAPNSTLDDTEYQSLNNHGQAVGRAIVNNDSWHGIIWDDVQGARDLNDLVTLPPNFVIDNAKMINDNGWIIAAGHYGVWSPERAVVLIPLSLPAPGDFDGNGQLDMNDIDALVQEITLSTNTALFDLTGDGLVDLLDLTEWLVLGGQSNLPSQQPYLHGDANLDGFVDGTDFNVWNQHKFTATSAWSRGDFNADGFTDGGDFNIWNAQKFSASAGSQTVPEPAGALVILLVTGIAAARRSLPRFDRKRHTHSP